MDCITTADRLEWLLSSIDTNEFLSDYLGKRVLVLHSADRTRFRHLLSLSDYQGIIAGLPSSNSKFEHRPSLAHRVCVAGDDGYLNMDAVLSGYAQGSTVYMDDVHRRHPPLKAFCAELAQSFLRHQRPLAECGPATVFLTPANSQALGPHIDPSDLFVLQLEGSKRWRFFGNTARSGAPGKLLDDLPACTLDVVLEPGSVAYIPRGFIHCANTTDTYSFATTIGFDPYSWRFVIKGIVERQLNRTPSLNQALEPQMIANGRLSTAGLNELRVLLRGLCNTEEFRDQARKYGVANGEAKLADFDEVHRLHALDGNAPPRAGSAQMLPRHR
jgi:ribosomal protein L16 Arg81 hydroxylase